MKKKSLAILLIMAMIAMLTLAACGSKDDGGEGGEVADAAFAVRHDEHAEHLADGRGAGIVVDPEIMVETGLSGEVMLQFFCGVAGERVRLVEEGEGKFPGQSDPGGEAIREPGDAAGLEIGHGFCLHG